MLMLSDEDKNHYMDHLSDLIKDKLVEEGSTVCCIQQIFQGVDYVGSCMRLRSAESLRFIWIENDEEWTTTVLTSLSDFYRHMRKKGSTFICKQYTYVRGKYENTLGGTFLLDLEGVLT